MSDTEAVTVHRARKIEATWSISLDVECPGCKENVDLTECDDFWDGGEPQPMEHRTARTTNREVFCPRCGHEFVCDFTY